MKIRHLKYSVIALLTSVVCIIFCITYEKVLKQEGDPNSMFHAIGVVANCVALSIIASSIFYYITDYFPKRRTQKTIALHIEESLKLLSKLGSETFTNISGKSFVSKSEFSTSCRKDLINDVINIVDDKSLFKKCISWIDYFEELHSLETLHFERVLIFESNIPVEVKICIENLKRDSSIINQFSCARNKYSEDKTKRMIVEYSEELYIHLTKLQNIFKLYKETTLF